MMKLKILFVSLIIWSLNCFIAQACPSGNLNSLNYIRRNNNRCEGIKQSIDIGGSVRLISLITRNINSLGYTLSLKIPQSSNKLKPEVSVRAINSRYQLDKITL